MPAEVAAELKEVATLDDEAPDEPLPLDPFPLPLLDLDPLEEVEPEFELAAEVEVAAAAEVLTTAKAAAEEELVADAEPAVTVTVFGTGQESLDPLAEASLLKWCGAARQEEVERMMREREEMS